MSVRSVVTTAVVTVAIVSMPNPVGSQQSPTPFGTTVEVTRILTEVRVVTFDGEPVLGLEPEDFRVKVDGQPAEVRSVLWIPSTRVAEASSPTEAAVDGPSSQAQPVAEGRTIVILFQIDFGLRVSRTEGLLRMSPRAAKFVQNLGPDDRVALLSFGSHLRLHSDFTSDHEAMAEMLGTVNILDAGGEPPAPAPPLLGEHLDPEAARKAADLSTALELIGQALREFPGTKSLVLFGYGLGSMSAGWRITIDDGYNRAMTALTQSRTSVFSLDLTDADYHSLEVGLRAVSEDTGGFFVRTHIFPDVAIDRLARVISSYYELEIIPPPDLEDDFIIKVKVNRPRVDVYVRQYNSSHYGW